MRAFMFLCLASVSWAAPQGYNYIGTQHVHQQYGPAVNNILKDLQAVRAVQSDNFVDSFADDGENYMHEAPTIQAAALPAAHTVTSALPAAFAPPRQTLARYLAPIHEPAESGAVYESSPLSYTQQQQVALVSKRFYLHSAPEEEDEEIYHKTITVGKPRKHFNVVFIRAPNAPAQRTNIKITPATSEDKTVIYVLSKKQEADEIEAQVHEPLATTVKPEVYFIKYKTAEEAAHAQQAIQSQYDSLGGSTQVSNEGVSPVLSVVGGYEAHGDSGEAAATASTLGHLERQENVGYLPPSRAYH